jgi:DNA replication protein DnaC
LPTALDKLDKYDCLILDDFGYVQKDGLETSVLFELICERYERKSMVITCNQPFKEWDKIFLDKQMALAAVDRLVHHATILEIEAESYRKRQALTKKKGG